jgi:hypothetical protein
LASSRSFPSNTQNYIYRKILLKSLVPSPEPSSSVVLLSHIPVMTTNPTTSHPEHIPKIAVIGIAGYGAGFIDYIASDSLPGFISVMKTPALGDSDLFNDQLSDSHLFISFVRLADFQSSEFLITDGKLDALTQGLSICLLDAPSFEDAEVALRAGFRGRFNTVIAILGNRGSIVEASIDFSIYKRAEICLRSIAELICEPGLIGIDFADVRSVLAKGGLGTVGIGESWRPEKASVAARRAREDLAQQGVNLHSVSGFLVNLESGDDTDLLEIDNALDAFFDMPPKVSKDDSNIMVGWLPKPQMNGRCRIAVVVAGISRGDS